jgi:hypothetical protein
MEEKCGLRMWQHGSFVQVGDGTIHECDSCGKSEALIEAECEVYDGGITHFTILSGRRVG